jgi:uncharacterized protein YigE (DUF2233 family)
VLSSIFVRTAVGDETPMRSEWTTLVQGLWYRPWSLSRGSEGPPVSGHVFRADPRVVRVTMIDARRDDRAAARVSDLRQESGAHVVVNGSFFDEKSRPLGLVVGDGEEQSSLRRVDQGIFLIAEGQPRIQHTRDALPPKVEMAIQAFPRLVVDGRPLRLKPQPSRRTSVCVPGDGTVLVVVVPTPVSLVHLAEALVLPPSAGGLGCWSALNLDGGPSTQLSVATPEMSLEVEGGWPVPNGLAILPK